MRFFSQTRMTIHRSSTRGTMRAISVFRDAWAMGRRDSGIRVPEWQPACESRDSGVTFHKLLEDVRSTLSGAMLLLQCSNIHVYSPTTNSRSTHSLALQVHSDDRLSTLSPTGFYSTYQVTDVRAKLYTESSVSNV